MSTLHVAKPSVFVALVHETTKAERFESYADLVETLKRRAARLGLAYDGDELWRAITHVEQTRGARLVPSSLVRPLAPDRPTPEATLGHDEAVRWLTTICRVTQAPGPRAMPQASARRELALQRVRRHLRVLLQAMDLTAAHCDALEEAMPRRDQNVGAPCSCLECQAAGVTDRPIVQVPPDEFISVPHWLHGESLRRWWEARDAFLALQRCDHKFVDSTKCVKCGWQPKEQHGQHR